MGPLTRRSSMHAYPVGTGCRFVLWGMILRVSNYPRTQLEFQHLFPDETASARHLERIRWLVPPELEALTYRDFYEGA